MEALDARTAQRGRIRSGGRQMGKSSARAVSKLCRAMPIHSRRTGALQVVIRTVVYSLLVAEIAMCVALFLRRRHSYPITAHAMIAVAAAYTVLLGIRYANGPFAYRDAVESSRWLFMLATTAVCIESVRLMARKLHASNFALATSILLAAMSGCAAWGTGHGLRTSTLGFTIEQEWAIGCVLFLAANHWLYSRAGALTAIAARHATGAMILLAGNAAALVILGQWRGVWAAEVAGLIIQRLGPIAGLLIWITCLGRAPAQACSSAPAATAGRNPLS